MNQEEPSAPLSHIPSPAAPGNPPERDAARVAASIFSTVFSPLLVPTYGVILAMQLSVLSFLPPATRWIVTAVTFLITCVIPLLAIILMWRMGMLKDPQLNNRTERTLPYVITGACYIGCAVYLAHHNAPAWLWALMAGGALATLICIGINTRWKISAHMAAMGGLVALLFRIAASDVEAVQLNWWLTAVVLAAGCVGSSRVLLGRHTLWQVIDGTAVGFICVFLFSMF